MGSDFKFSQLFDLTGNRYTPDCWFLIEKLKNDYVSGIINTYSVTQPNPAVVCYWKLLDFGGLFFRSTMSTSRMCLLITLERSLFKTRHRSDERGERRDSSWIRTFWWEGGFFHRLIFFWDFVLKIVNFAEDRENLTFSLCFPPGPDFFSTALTCQVQNYGTPPIGQNSQLPIIL